MAESTLSLSRVELLRLLARQIGWDTDSSNRSAQQNQDLDDILAGALRRFYFAASLPNQPPHQWSFLRPTTTLTTVADDYDYDLPDDYGALDGPLTYAAETEYPHIRITDELHIRQMRQTHVSSGEPRFAAVRPKASDGTTGQRFEMLLWPTPDEAYVLSYRYMIAGSAITSDAPYPLGGSVHAETIKAACRAAAEMHLEDVHGQYWNDYMMMLRASIENDRRYHAPDTLGYNADHSDIRRTLQRSELRGNRVTYNGVEYD